jgi:hypothetical protein
VLAGRVEPKAAAVLTQIVGAHAACWSSSARFASKRSFEARLVALEEGARKRWGA